MAGAVVMTTHRMWASLDMRVALARHDVGTVFRLMQRYGFSQRAIAAQTGITQAEVSEIITGRRRVLAYSVLERLADGLQLPRGWVGLAFDDESQLLRHGTTQGPLSQPTARYARESRAARRRAKALLLTGRACLGPRRVTRRALDIRPRSSVPRCAASTVRALPRSGSPAGCPAPQVEMLEAYRGSPG
jgi:transcriptional regulator with XRE-family HTH domain